MKQKVQKMTMKNKIADIVKEMKSGLTAGIDKFTWREQKCIQVHAFVCKF